MWAQRLFCSGRYGGHQQHKLGTELLPTAGTSCTAGITEGRERARQGKSLDSCPTHSSETTEEIFLGRSFRGQKFSFPTYSKCLVSGGRVENCVCTLTWTERRRAGEEQTVISLSPGSKGLF